MFINNYMANLFLNTASEGTILDWQAILCIRPTAL